MKTKPFLIALFAGIIMLTFASCTDLKIKSVESKVSHLEKNYRDKTKSEFNEAYDKYMAELKEISKEELTKNQKKKIVDLKWRLREVWVRYHSPIGQILPEGDRLSSQDVAASLSKLDLSAGGDTLTLDAYFSELEKVASALQAIHVESAVDTLQLVELENQLANNPVWKSDVESEHDQMKQSEKVRCLQIFVSYTKELLRLDGELKAVGIESSKWNLGKDEEQFKAVLKEMQGELKAELE